MVQKLGLSLMLGLAWAGAYANPVPAEWKARYKQLEKAFSSKDMAAIEALCAKELVWVQVDGTKKHRKETLAEFSEMFKAKKISGHEKLHGWAKRGDTVDVYCEVSFTLAYPGKPDTKLHSFCVDSWKKFHGKWLLIRTVDKRAVPGGK